MEYLNGAFNVQMLGLDPSVTVHSMRVTAITTPVMRGCDLIDLQLAGHSDPRTTLATIRNRDRFVALAAYAAELLKRKIRILTRCDSSSMSLSCAGPVMRC